MHANAQIFLNDLTTIRAHLRSVPWVDPNQFPASFFRFVGQQIRESRPCRVVNVFVENRKIAFDHVLRLQVLDADKPESVNQIPAQFVQEVFSLIADPCVQGCKFLSCLASSFGRMFSLKFFEFGFTSFQVLGIVDNFPVRKNGQRFDSNVNTDFFRRYGEGLWLDLITRENSIEVSGFSFDCNRFNLAFDLPVKPDSDLSDILNVKPFAFKPDTVTVRRECNRIKSVFPFKTWEPGCITFLDAPEKGPESFIKTAKNILRRGTIEPCQSFVKASNFFKRVGLVVVVDRLTGLLPAYDSMLKGTVVEKPSGIEQAFKSLFVAFLCPQSVFKRFPHLLTFLRFDVFTNCFIGDMPNTSSVVASAPKGWKTAAKRREFGSHRLTRISLESINDFCNTHSGIMFKKQVNVVRHYLESLNRKPKFFRFLTEKFFKPLGNCTHKHLSPVLGAPNDVKFQAENSPGVFGVSLHSGEYTLAGYLTQQLI